MRLLRRGSAFGPAVPLFGLGMVCIGCASPGAPKPPSLQIPQAVDDLSVTRSGATVQIRFTAPSRTTDGVGLRGTAQASVCRVTAPNAPCRSVDFAEIDGANPAPRAVRPGEAVLWTDNLPQALASGPVRPLVYRLTVRNGAGRSAGMSDPAYAAAGSAPPQVSGLRAEGTRSGVLLRWTANSAGGEVLLERRQLDPPPEQGRRRNTPRAAGRSEAEAAAGVVLLQAEPGNLAAAQTVDGTAQDGFRYRYQAVRREVVHAGGRTLELRSEPSSAVEVTWRDAYPPPAPEGLTALGFVAPAPGGGSAYAVDLVWQPVDDRRVTGYAVRRVALSSTGAPQGGPVLLTAEPVITPAFHDGTALAGTAYRYEVIAVDAKGNSSAVAQATVGTSEAP